MSDVDEKIQKVTSRLQTLGYKPLLDPKIGYENKSLSDYLVIPVKEIEKRVDALIEKLAPPVKRDSRKMDDGRVLEYLTVSHNSIPLIEERTNEYMSAERASKLQKQAEDIRKKKVQMAKRNFLSEFQKLEAKFSDEIDDEVVSEVRQLVRK
jgi:hypothetical protein